MPNHEIIAQLRERVRHGVVPAMASPLEAGGYRVNESAVSTLVSFLIDAGVKGLFVGGTTGEGILLSGVQRQILHKATIDAAGGRVAVLLHVGANTLVESIELAEHAETLGADAIVAVTPYFYPLPDHALLAYYKNIAAAAPRTPLMAYDIPQMAINGITPDMLTNLIREIPTFAGLKSSRPNAQVVRKLVDRSPTGTIVLAGNERIALGLLALGVDGLISGLSTAIPEPFVALTQAFASGDMVRAIQLQRTVNKLLDVLPAGERIGAIKQLLEERSIAAGPPVPPRPNPAESWPGWSKMKAILQETG